MWLRKHLPNAIVVVFNVARPSSNFKSRFVVVRLFVHQAAKNDDPSKDEERAKGGCASANSYTGLQGIDEQRS